MPANSPSPPLPNQSPPRTWQRPRAIRQPWLRAALWVGAVGYLAAALASIEIRPDAIARGIPLAGEFIGQFFEPSFTTHGDAIAQGILESLAMTVVATVLGVAISIPIGFGAARNLVPRWVYLGCRALIAVSRAFHELIVAVIVVRVVGFGPLAGVITLTFATVGFFSKLLADAIEAENPAPLEAIRATGANWWQTLVYGVWPAAKPRAVGLAMYRLDINFRESAILGVVGAGGIGNTLETSVRRFDFDVTAAILLIIVAIVLLTEFVAGKIRQRMI